VHKLINKIRSSRYKTFIKFTIVGGSGAIIDFGFLTLGVEIFHWPLLIANAIGFSLAATSNFFLNKLWTFHNPNSNYLKQFSMFLVVAGFGLLLNSSILQVLTSLSLHYLLAKAVACLVVALWNFFMNKNWTFRHL
jgi:putative flippase GtrA